MDNLTLKDCLKNYVDSYGLDSVVKALVSALVYNAASPLNTPSGTDAAICRLPER